MPGFAVRRTNKSTTKSTMIIAESMSTPESFEGMSTSESSKQQRGVFSPPTANLISSAFEALAQSFSLPTEYVTSPLPPGEVGEQRRGTRRDPCFHQHRRTCGGVVHEEGTELQPAHGPQADR